MATKPAAVEVVPANMSDQQTLAELLSAYAREFSGFHPVAFEADGSFIYPHLQAYWHEPGRFPFLIRIGGATAGFILVHRLESDSGGEPVFDIAEFFVVHAFRLQHAGTIAAHIVWRRFPDLWQVRVLEANQGAVRFWATAIRRFTGFAAPSISFTANGETWRRSCFDSRSDKDCFSAVSIPIP
jgi:predicted acetyltransferase